MTEQRCRKCGGRIGLTRGMVACLPDAGDSCTPVCRNCGRDLVPQKAPPADPGRRFWERSCGCVPEPEVQYDFTADEVARFRSLVRGRGFEVDDAIARMFLNSLANTGTKMVLGAPGGDIVITADEASAAIGRQLPD